MIQLHQFNTQIQLFQTFKETIENYNNNFNQQFQIFEQEKEEDNEKAYERAKQLFDQYEDNINNLNHLIQMKNQIIEFFNHCEENKNILINQKNQLINQLIKLKNNPNGNREEYLQYRNYWNQKRIETVDEKNRRECEEMLDDMVEKQQLIEKLSTILKNEREQIEKKYNELNELIQHTNLIEIKNDFNKRITSIENDLNEFQQCQNEINSNTIKSNELNQLKNEINNKIEEKVKKEDFKKLSNEVVKMELFNQLEQKMNETVAKEDYKHKTTNIENHIKLMKQNFKELNENSVKKSELKKLKEKVDRRVSKDDFNKTIVEYVKQNEYNSLKENVNDISNKQNEIINDCVKKNEYNKLKEKVEEKVMKEEFIKVTNDCVKKNELTTTLNKYIEQTEFDSLKTVVNDLSKKQNDIPSQYVSLNNYNEMKQSFKNLSIQQQEISSQCVKRNEFNELSFNYESNLSIEEMKQIEEWTNKKCDTILFHSDKDDWSIETSVFDKKVSGKNNLIFVVEDTMNNKFGYYFNGTIDLNKSDSYLKGNGCFLFTLYSNGRVNGMMKFEQKNRTYGFIVNDKTDDALFAIHWGFSIKKENKKNKSSVNEYSKFFDYHGTTKAFHPDLTDGSWKEFTPKRFVVIEMK